MPDPAGAVAEPSLAEYIRSENQKERAETRDDGPTVLTGTETPAVVPVEALAEPPAAEPQPEPEVVAPPVDAERNPDGTFKAGKPKNEWQRNRELTARLRDAERQLAAARDIPQPPAPVPPQQAPVRGQAQPWADPRDPKPSIDAYLDQPDPYAALAVEAGMWAVREDRRANQFQEGQREAQRAQQAVAERVATFIAAHPDYPERMAGIEDIHFQGEVLDALVRHEQGPAVAYHLALNPVEARRIAALRPDEALMAIGMIQGRMTAAPSGSAAPAVSISRAKALIKPVSASPVVPDSGPPDPEKTSLTDWIRLGNADDRRRREALRGA